MKQRRGLMGWPTVLLAVLSWTLLGGRPLQGEELRLALEPERGYVIGDVPVQLHVSVRDRSGALSRRHDGELLRCEGLAIRGPHGELRPLRAGPALRGGTARLDAVVVADEVVVQVGSLRTRWLPRRIPGWFSVVPPAVAILLALLTRQVLLALFVGIYIGVLVVEGWSPLVAFLRTLDRNILQTVADSGHAAVLLFTAALGGMIGVISRSGGMEATVLLLGRRIRSRRGGMFTSWLLGVLVFFDDYANCLLVGATLRPFTDKLRISREKLSFIVDSTAAPVATLALVSTWVGYQLGQFETAHIVPSDQVYSLFLHCLPYSFYSIFTLLFVLMLAVTERDFGPMYAAECRAVRLGQVLRNGAAPLSQTELPSRALLDPADVPRAVWVPVGAILVVVLTVVLGLYFSGRAALGEAAEDASLRDIIGSADPYQALIWASFGGGFFAIAASVLAGLCTLSEAMDAWVSGCRSMMLALIILVLAWTIGDVCREYLLTGPWLVNRLHPPPALMPPAVFLISALISFSTGTSFGTMAIVIPVAAPMVWAVTGEGSGLSPDTAAIIRYAALGSVLSGAVFGDHCSPLSDTTILSSMASAADHIDHVRTQAPYALVTATVAAMVGYLPAGFGVTAPWSLLTGFVVLVAVVCAVGKRVDATAHGQGPTGKGVEQ